MFIQLNFGSIRVDWLSSRRAASLIMLIAAFLTTEAEHAKAQQSAAVSRVVPPDSVLASLISAALDANPSLLAAQYRAAAAQARIASAGARPDPMLMFGAINVPLNSLSFSDDDMTMKMIGVEQTLPYPGKLGLRQKVAAFQASAAAASADSARLSVRRDVKIAYYELAYVDAALAVLERNNNLLADIARLAGARYSTGVGMQQDVLRATLDATRLNESANALREERIAVLARLNAILARPGATPIDRPTIPQSLVLAAVAASSDIRFSSQDLGASATGSPLLPLSGLQMLAVNASPTVRARTAMVSAATAELALGKKEFLPDVDLSIQYGQRSGFATGQLGQRVSRADMISAVVSIPIPIQRSRKQNAGVAAGNADLSALEAEEHETENSIGAEIARIYSDLTHNRTQLALYVKAIIPQARATVTSAIASYQSGAGGLLPVLTAQTTLLDLESGYHRALTDFAQKIAELEAVVGSEVLR